MPATTRARTGSSKPRVIQAIENTIAPKKTTKANTSKPRSTGTASGRVTKTTKVKKPRTKTEKVVDKIVGSGEKVVGDVEGKPGKKVRSYTRLSFEPWEFVASRVWCLCKGSRVACLDKCESLVKLLTHIRVVGSRHA